MRRTIMRAATAAAFLAPGTALAQHFDAVDFLTWPYRGGFAAYPAEPLRPTSIYARFGILHDSNIFRLSKDINTTAALGTSTRSELVTRAGAGITHEQRIVGRQGIRLTAEADRYSYDSFKLLDHTAYLTRGEWLWEATNDLSGVAGLERRHRLADLAQRQRPVRDLIDEDAAFANGAWRVGPHVRLRGGLTGTRAKHSDNAFNTADARTHSGLVGADYVSGLDNTIGLEFRQTRGNMPTEPFVGAGVVVDNDFTERERALTAAWFASPQLRLDGRIGHTTRRHVQLPERNFEGTTWRATADWTPLNKTGFNFTVYRAPNTIVDIAASYVVVTGVGFGPRWAPTEKLVFNAMLVTESQKFSGDPSQFLLGAPLRDETVRTLRLGAGWEPVKFFELSSGIEHGRRSSNLAFRDYKFTSYMVNGRIRF